MSWHRVIWLTVCLSFVLSTPALASPGFDFEHIQREDAPRDAVAVSINSTSWLSLEGAWLRRLENVLGPRDLSVGAELDLPVLTWLQTRSVDTFRASGSVGMELYSWRSFSLVAQLRLDTRVQHDFMGTRFGLGTTLFVMPGLEVGRTSIAGVLGLSQGLTTHISHSEYVEDAFDDRYPEDGTGSRPSNDGPEDGWYAFPATRVPLGAAVSIRASEFWSIQSSAGIVLTPDQFDTGLFDMMNLGVWPFWIDVGVARRF